MGCYVCMCTECVIVDLMNVTPVLMMCEKSVNKICDENAVNI